jgi:hemerythrin-like domain-containing protein
MNAIQLLRSDHSRLRDLLPRLYDMSIASEERNRLREEIEKEIKIHSMVEEEIFYPAWKDATHDQKDRDQYFESIEEHHVVDMLLPELMPLDPSSDSFRAKAKVLRELFEHHAREEEEDMFPRAEQLFSPARWTTLVRRWSPAATTSTRSGQAPSATPCARRRWSRRSSPLRR